MVTIIGDDPDEALAICDTYAAAGLTAVITPQYSDRAIAAGIPFAEACFPPALLAQLPAGRPIAPIETFLRTLFTQPLPPRISWALGPVQPQLCSDDLLTRTAHLATEFNLPVSTHLYETRTEAVLARQTLAADDGSMVGRLARLNLLNHRLIIGHGVWITAAEITRCAAAGSHLACNAVTNLKLLNGPPPLATYARHGVNIGLGCDNTSAGDAQDIFQTIKLTALTLGMQSPPDTSTAASTAAATAFAAATIGGATALALPIGRIAPHHQADLCLFDLSDPNWRPLNNALNQLVYGNPGRSLTTVFAAGNRLLRHHQPTRANNLPAEVEAMRAQLDNEFEMIGKQVDDMRCAYLGVFNRAQEYPLPEF